jgi:hypothetical protein
MTAHTAMITNATKTPLVMANARMSMRANAVRTIAPARSSALASRLFLNSAPLAVSRAMKMFRNRVEASVIYALNAVYRSIESCRDTVQNARAQEIPDDLT